MKLKQSFCYPLYKKGGMTFDALFASAAKIGYAATELWFRGADFEELAASAKRNSLALASMCGHGTLKDGMNRRENHDRIEAEVRASLEVAVKHGIPNLICFSGNRQPGQAEEDAIAACVEGLCRVAPHAEKAGINLNVELLNSKVDHPGYQCDRTAWGVAVCERVKSSRVKLLYDIYHMQIMEGDVIRTIREHIRWIGHFHTAGNPGRNDLDDTQELNYPPICRAILAAGYQGYLAHEFTPKGDPVKALRKAFALCDQG